MKLVGVTCTHLQRDIHGYRSRFEQSGLSLVLPEIPGQELAGTDLIAAMDGLVGVVAGDDHFTRDVMEQLPEMRVISKWGIGLDGIDLAAAADLGVVVTNTPGMFGHEVAEQALAYLFSLVRGTVEVDRAVRAGGWPKPVGRSMGALHAGVIGLGDIGSRLASKLQALGLTVTGADPSDAARDWASSHGIKVVVPAELATKVDVVIVTAPLNPATVGLIDEVFVASMKPGGLLINVGRGPVVVGEAIAKGLESGHLAGAALDVFEVEPLADERLRNAPNLILGSHNASNTFEACHRTHDRAISNLVDGLREFSRKGST